MSSTAVRGRRDGDIHRRVEHIVRMPSSLALASAASRGWPGCATTIDDCTAGRQVPGRLDLSLRVASYGR